MKIFISWSGELSRQIAEELKEWIEQVIQATEPWISTEIEKGKRWNSEIASKLEDSKVRIFCITRENINAPWILFEAGAISKTNDSHVCTLLFNLSPSDISDPLSLFQATKFSKNEVYSLLSTINKKLGQLGGKSLDDNKFSETFELYWPILEKKINGILSGSNTNVNNKAIRSDRELLEECIETLRQL